MIDPGHEHGAGVVVDADQDPVVTAAGTAVGDQLASERLAQPLGVVGEWARHELDDGRGHLGRQTV